MEREGKEEWVLSVPQANYDFGITNFEKAVSSGQARNWEQNMGVMKRGPRRTSSSGRGKTSNKHSQSMHVIGERHQSSTSYSCV